MNRHILIIALILTLTFATALTARTHIHGVGIRESQEAAFAEAQMQIAQQISVQIQATSEFKSLDLEAEGVAYYSQSIAKSIQLSVDQSIKGIEIVSSSGLEIISDSEKRLKYEVEARLSIAKLLSSLQAELDALKTSAMFLLLDAQTMLKDGKPLFALINYDETQALIPEIYAKKSMYDSFAPTRYYLPEELSIPALESSMRALISRISLELISGDHQSAPNMADLPQPVVFAAIYRGESGERIPLPTFPVRISYGDGTLIETGVTDAGGFYSIKPKALRLEGTNKLICSPDAKTPLPHLARLLNLHTATATYEVEAAEQTLVRIKVFDEYNSRQTSLERSVARALDNSIFVVSPDADLELSGILIVESVQMQEGISSPQFVAKVRLDLRFTRLSSSRSLGTFSADGVGLSTKGEGDAIKNAIGKVNINARRFSAQLVEYLEAEWR